MRYVLWCLLLILPLPAQANEANRLRQADFLPQAQELVLKNQAVLTYLWVDVYAAALYAAPQVSARQAWNQQQDLRLALYYFRDIDRDDVLKAATATLKRQHSAAALARLQPALDQLHGQFRPIRKGDRYALALDARRGLSLEINGQVVFTSRDAELAKIYLGLWLAPDGLSDSLRTRLLE